MEGENENNGKRVCVTGGTGFVASSLIFKLLQTGYSVNTTLRSFPEKKKDITYLTNLAGASERLQIFNADLDKPDSFGPAIEGCIGVFHVAHPIDFQGKESEEQLTKRAINGTLGILNASINAKTVKKFVYTSSIATVASVNNGQEIVDEMVWSDIDSLQRSNVLAAVYSITKTLTEKTCLEFGEKHGLDVICVLPSCIHGPFLTPTMPGSVVGAMSMIFGYGDLLNLLSIPFVHIDDVVRAHIFLFENPRAKGRYICSATEITMENLAEFLAARYPQYPIIPHCPSESKASKIPKVSSKKLLDIGFNYKYGLDEMFDDAIRCCKEKGILN
ncbi:hypothetical protein M9H77_16004 [Catharanthus roseus]|uniref:Uncharacterized protein n=1 Tax=Catharanthus roseus TaxID=4058 RepID=A0ACC0B171_CATRO|nr:hypothetical protein M9H77_16004 [Catharanthus roseus]